MIRKDRLVTGEIYHIFTKSIAEFKIFNSDHDYFRMKNILRYYQVERDIQLRFSEFIRLEDIKRNGFDHSFLSISEHKEKMAQIIAYCFMPTHVHLILKQLKDDGISRFMCNVLNSYSRYFNVKHKRRGPLWEGKFKNVLIATDEHLLHLSRYVHLNPVTSYSVEKSEEWPWSSYREYLSRNNDDSICDYGELLEIKTSEYKKFVEDRISYQRELAKIKKYLFD